jgi:urease accessory protein
MGWQGRLELRYRREGNRTVAHDRHHGPLRVLASLYPELPTICHHVLVHPPGGMVGGDSLTLDADLGAGTHALITTPSATRYYRCDGDRASQVVHARLGDDARLEWLPMETIVHDGARAANHMRFELACGAQMIGWEVLALGLPAANAPFLRGCFEQTIEVPGLWLERGRIDAADKQLLDSPLGFDGHRVMGTLWFAAGMPLQSAQNSALTEAALDAMAGSSLAATSGVTALRSNLVLLRVLAPRVEPAMQTLWAVWQRWRQTAWGIAGTAPRIWST